MITKLMTERDIRGLFYVVHKIRKKIRKLREQYPLLKITEFLSAEVFVFGEDDILYHEQEGLNDLIEKFSDGKIISLIDYLVEESSFKSYPEFSLKVSKISILHPKETIFLANKSDESFLKSLFIEQRELVKTEDIINKDTMFLIFYPFLEVEYTPISNRLEKNYEDYSNVILVREIYNLSARIEDSYIF